MQTVTVKNITVGGGKTAICAPLMGRTADELRAELAMAVTQKPDMLEWRADYFEHACDAAACVAVLQLFRNEMPEMPVLFTLRAAAEGGAQDIPRTVARQVYSAVCSAGLVDIVDIERANHHGFLRDVMDGARQAGVKVILSAHNFNETPAPNILVKMLLDAQELEPDFVKIAVMPNAPEDVLSLLFALETFTRGQALVPAIAIAMGNMGIITRAAGGLFGSAVTYASLGENAATAPGQINVAALRSAMRLLTRDSVLEA